MSDGKEVIDLATLTLSDLENNESDGDVGFDIWYFFVSKPHVALLVFFVDHDDKFIFFDRIMKRIKLDSKIYFGQQPK